MNAYVVAPNRDVSENIKAGDYTRAILRTSIHAERILRNKLRTVITLNEKTYEKTPLGGLINLCVQHQLLCGEKHSACTTEHKLIEDEHVAYDALNKWVVKPKHDIDFEYRQQNGKLTQDEKDKIEACLNSAVEFINPPPRAEKINE